MQEPVRVPEGHQSGCYASSVQGFLAEIQREKAAALGRIAGMLESHLSELQRLRETLENQGPDAAPETSVAYDQVREEALRWRWYLLVQRESLGLRDPLPVLEHYPVPAPRLSRGDASASRAQRLGAPD